MSQLSESAILHYVTALCEIESVSCNEDRICARAAGLMRDAGLEVEEQEVLPGRRNVLATFRTGRPGPRLLLNGHLDTLLPPPGYTRDPYHVEIIDGRLYAAEVNNMKAAVGGMMAVMAELPRLKSRLRGEIVLSAVIGECDALGLGTVHMLDEGFKADLCINGEPTDLAVMTSHSGVTQLKLEVTGRSAHVSQREHGVNAIDKLVGLLPRFTEAALSFERHEAFPGLPTINVGVIKGGTLPSMLAGSAEAGIDVRTVPGMSPQSVLADLRRVLAVARNEDGMLDATLELSPRPGFCQERPFHMDSKHPVVAAVARAHKSITGKPATVGTLIPQVFFGTDASHILASGIPTAIYGPGRVTDINSPDESMAVEDMVTAARTYLASVIDICGRKEG